MFSTVPRINAPFQPGDQSVFPGQISVTGDVNSWLFVSSPDYRTLGQFGFRSFHPGGANFLMGDGSCRFLKQTIDMGSPVYSSNMAMNSIGVYRKLSTIQGGEVISSTPIESLRPDFPEKKETSMKTVPLTFLLAASLIFVGCDSGGPGVATPTAEKGVSEGGPTPTKAVSTALKKKREKQSVSPKGPE